jgi:hypothetical protein
VAIKSQNRSIAAIAIMPTVIAPITTVPIDYGPLCAFCRSCRPLARTTSDGLNRWLVRWLSEAQKPSIEQAAELAATLADGKEQPAALSGLQHI